MAIKTIAVCGCSWSAISHLPEYRGTHFSELLAREMGAELHNFAVGGVSNFVIRLQIEEAIKINPDLVIVTATSYDRIEIPSDRMSLPGETLILEKVYNPYLAEPGDYFIKTSTITNLVEKNYPHVEEYIKYYYSPDAKSLADRWLIRDGITQLKNKNIPFLLQPQKLWGYDLTHATMFFSDLVKEIVPTDVCLFNGVTKPNLDPGYHSDPDAQIRFTNRLISYIKECKLDL